jgi:hypothetical protein
LTVIASLFLGVIAKGRSSLLAGVAGVEDRRAVDATERQQVDAMLNLNQVVVVNMVRLQCAVTTSKFRRFAADISGYNSAGGTKHP